jgi:hypothetical protein
MLAAVMVKNAKAKKMLRGPLAVKVAKKFWISSAFPLILPVAVNQMYARVQPAMTQ